MMTFSVALLALAHQSAPAEFSNPGWLEGCWEGSGLGAPATECWMDSPSGRLTGVFQLMNDQGGQVFSEIMVIDNFEDGAALRLKHFHADLTGWERADEYVAFPFVSQTDTALIFDGLEMHLQPDGTLFVDVVLSEGEETQTARFEYRRVE